MFALLCWPYLARRVALSMVNARLDGFGSEEYSIFGITKGAVLPTCSEVSDWGPKTGGNDAQWDEELPVIGVL